MTRMKTLCCWKDRHVVSDVCTYPQGQVLGIAGAHLFVTNGEFALGFFVLAREILKRFDGVVLQHFDAKGYVAFRVFVAGLVGALLVSLDRDCGLGLEWEWTGRLVDWKVKRLEEQRSRLNS